MQNIFTPWRAAYVSRQQAEPGCFLCTAALAPDDPDGLVVATTRHHLVMLNLHPYASGHLLVAPLAHVGSPQDSSLEARAELWPLVLRVQRVLATAYAPHGFNLGMNLGQPAGAGVPDHFHFHVVPRWAGDTNFMTVLAEVRLIPENPRQSRERLRALFAVPEPEEEPIGGNREL
jgi:ATP adenylyltransferase